MESSSAHGIGRDFFFLDKALAGTWFHLTLVVDGREALWIIG
jgi:hypothetical protein